MENNLIERAVTAVKNLIGRTVPPVEEAKAQRAPASTGAKPDRNMREEIMRRTLAAFSGPDRGDIGGHKPGSPEEVLDRHTRQKR